MKQLVTLRRASTFRAVCLGCVSILMVACGGGGGEGDSADASSEGADAAVGQGLTFRLSFAPPAPQAGESIFVQVTCGQDWVSVIDGDGNPVRIDADCGFCSCESCNPCAVCDCAFLIEPVAAGTSRDHGFDGVIHPTASTDECAACQTSVEMTPGTYTARFCYSRDEELQQPRECGEQSFTYPSPGAVVEHIVEN